MFYGADVNHARLLPLCNGFVDHGDNTFTVSMLRVDGLITIIGTGFRCPRSPLRPFALTCPDVATRR